MKRQLTRQLACLILAATTASLVGCDKLKGSSGAGGAPKTEDQKTLYALGLMLGRNIGVFNLSKDELEQVKAGMSDQVLKNKPAVELEAYGPKVDGMARARQEASTVAEKGRAKQTLEAAEKESGAIKTPSGMVFRTIKPGTGPNPAASDKVKVHYVGTLPDGTEFDSSVKRKEPATFPLNGVIKCWTEGVQRMKVGEKAKLTCPSDLAYGDSGHPPTIPGGATLIFDVELLEILKS
ncbi:MAG TPA: FKBP-type peptidyl-prolyl cis-trans isomerase [Polyangia bacterium]|nr:FKBP-type peptidyl-prolyl cis-trans isomerase [Polyangia bacterium]